MSSAYFQSLFLVTIFFLTVQAVQFRSSFQREKTGADELKEILFPNRTAQLRSSNSRRLDTVACTVCQGLTTCTALNGYQIQETYYPNNLNYLQTCKVIDDLGARLEPLIFGDGRTFRDTTQCRDIVMQYLCLFYGSDNTMYVNECVNQEDVKDPNPANHKVAPRPPCKSFCVQTAQLCANDPDYFIQTCNEIACPPVEDQCTPDPIISGETLAANLGCTVPYYDNPYFNAGSRLYSTHSVFVVALVAVVTLYSLML